MNNISDKVKEEIKTHVYVIGSTFSLKSCYFSDNVEKYNTDGQDRDNIICHMRISCWTTKATNTQSE